MNIPQSLRIWFIVHFVIDILLAIPLIFFPKLFLTFLGFNTVEPLTARLLGAALVGIGGVSLLTKNRGKESYSSLLLLKILWSSTAIIALLISLWEGAPTISWAFLFIFLGFNILWIYYKQRIEKLEERTSTNKLKKEN